MFKSIPICLEKTSFCDSGMDSIWDIIMDKSDGDRFFIRSAVSARFLGLDASSAKISCRRLASPSLLLISRAVDDDNVGNRVFVVNVDVDGRCDGTNA